VTVTGKDAHGDLISRTVRTDARGRFAVTALLPGLYDIKLNAAPSAVKVGQSATAPPARPRARRRRPELRASF